VSLPGEVGVEIDENPLNFPVADFKHVAPATRPALFNRRRKFFLRARGDLATNPFGFSLPLQRRTATLERMVDLSVGAASEVGA
jgi:hypothetical protein